MEQEKEEEEQGDVHMEESTTPKKQQDENAMTTRRGSIKRISLRPTTSKEPQKSPFPAKGKAAKTRLSSTLDALPAGKGAGKPSSQASSFLLQTNLLHADHTLTGSSTRGSLGHSSGEEETTPARTSKRQRFTPPHLTA